MEIWQFWVLIGVICLWGVYVTTLLDRIFFVIERCQKALERIDQYTARIPNPNDRE